MIVTLDSALRFDEKTQCERTTNKPNKPTTREQANNQHFKRFIGRVTFSYCRWNIAIPTAPIPSDIWASTQRIQRIEGQRGDHKGLFCGKKTESVDDSLGFHSRVYFAWCFAWCLWFPYCPTTGRKWKPEVDSRILLFLFLILFIPLDA